jgi:hypothetical protein
MAPGTCNHRLGRLDEHAKDGWQMLKKDGYKLRVDGSTA